MALHLHLIRIIPIYEYYTIIGILAIIAPAECQRGEILRLPERRAANLGDARRPTPKCP